ncbi:Uncharacterised protein [Mycobacteroides abscessus subsp. abscessus]|nr:Uncharacterised protein [Mycobacteroides abscessus subsp. abscessus]
MRPTVTMGTFEVSNDSSAASPGAGSTAMIPSTCGGRLRFSPVRWRPMSVRSRPKAADSSAAPNANSM